MTGSAGIAAPLSIQHRDAGSRARAGRLHLAHGEVRTPAFVPLATKGSVRGLEPHEVAGLGFDMVLGNTLHLMLQPGPELIDELGGLHRFMGWDGPIITDSGGFQVFSMGHGTVADEIKGRQAQGERTGSIPFTTPFVASGTNAGVRTTPWAVRSSPVRARLCASRAVISKTGAIGPPT